MELLAGNILYRSRTTIDHFKGTPLILSNFLRNTTFISNFTNFYYNEKNCYHLKVRMKISIVSPICYRTKPKKPLVVEVQKFDLKLFFTYSIIFFLNSILVASKLPIFRFQWIRICTVLLSPNSF